MKAIGIALSAIVLSFSMSARAADYPAPKQGDWIAKDFRFHTGETMPELKLHYTTVGEPTGQPVLVLHGTGGSGASMLGAALYMEDETSRFQRKCASRIRSTSKTWMDLHRGKAEKFGDSQYDRPIQSTGEEGRCRL